MTSIVFCILLLWGALSLWVYKENYQNTLSSWLVTGISVLVLFIEIIAIGIVFRYLNLFLRSSISRIVLLWMFYTSVICFFTSDLFYFDIREVLWFPSIFLIFYYIGVTDSIGNVGRIFKNTILLIVPINILLYVAVRSIMNSLSGTVLFSSNQIFFVLLLLPFLPFIKSKVIKYILFGIMAAAVLYSFKRSALLCMGVVLLISLYFDFVKGKGIRILKYLPILLVLVLIAVRIYVNIDESTGGHITDRIENTEEDKGSGRLDVWKSVLSNWLSSNYIFGNGHNSVVKAGIAREGGYGQPLSAHNDFIEVIYDYGVVGIMIYVAYTCKILLLCRKRIVGRYKFLHQSVCLAWIVFIIMSSVSHLVLYPTYNAYLVMIFAMGSGILNQHIYGEGRKYNHSLL